MQAPLSIKDRLKVAASAYAAWVLGLAPLLVFGWRGLAWVKILSFVSLPLVALVCVVAFLFASSIRARPLVWSTSAAGAAAAVSIVAMYAITRSWIGVVSLLVAVPAAAAFLGLWRMFLRPRADPRLHPTPVK